MNKILLIIIFASTFSSCWIFDANCDKVEFEDNEKFWFDKYERGEKIIFESNRGDFDTIFITGKIVNKPTGKCNKLVKEYSSAYARIDYSMKKDSFNELNDYFVQLVAEPNEGRAIPVIRLLNMEFDGNSRIVTTKTFLRNLDKEMNDCFKFDSSNCGMNYNQKSGIVNFIWSKEIGLIKYTNVKGEIWEYLKKE
jgi:hypothetical protein